jgi:hypothetical protein
MSENGFRLGCVGRYELMRFDLDQSIQILERTPETLTALLSGLSEEWTHEKEGPDAWSPFDVVGHLIHGEKTDWIPRAKFILEHGDSRTFEPFDRFAQYETSRGKSMSDLLEEFADLRLNNVEGLRDMDLGSEDLDRTGTHPELGPVTLGQLLATWTVHDLDHIAQIARAMARQYTAEVGGWRTHLRILG